MINSIIYPDYAVFIKNSEYSLSIRYDDIWVHEISDKDGLVSRIWRRNLDSNYQNYIFASKHRLNGPAIEHRNEACQEWWYKNKFINCSSQKEFEKLIKLINFW